MRTNACRTFLYLLLFTAPCASTAQAGLSACNGPPNGIVDGSEECETGDCCTNECLLKLPATICRPSGGDPVCDPFETCGKQEPAVDAACPPDAFAENGTGCDDGQYCTIPDTCTDGACGGDPRECFDGDVCTDDLCDEEGDTCAFPDNEADCDDGSFCTTSDACQGGLCLGVERDCSDENTCTTDLCDEEADMCVHENNTLPCDDGDECTAEDACDGGVCTGIAIPSCGPTTTTTLPPPTTTSTTTTFTTTSTTAACPACGDFNGDCSITAGDALSVLKAAVGSVSCALAICDVNGDGKVTAADALAALRAAVGLAVDLDCPQGSSTTTTLP